MSIISSHASGNNDIILEGDERDDENSSVTSAGSGEERDEVHGKCLSALKN
jgi:hypothetical protein